MSCEQNDREQRSRLDFDEYAVSKHAAERWCQRVKNVESTNVRRRLARQEIRPLFNESVPVTHEGENYARVHPGREIVFIHADGYEEQYDRWMRRVVTVRYPNDEERERWTESGTLDK
jgi:hypothetical protein